MWKKYNLSRETILVLVGAVAISFLLYGNSLKGEFVWDDLYMVVRPELRDPGYLMKLWLDPLDTHISESLSYRPMLIFSMMMNFLVSGESPFWFRVTNLVLNGGVVFLTYMLVKEIFQDKRLATFSALIFAFLPIHSESVALIKSRDEIMAAMFILGAWIVFLRGYTKLRLELLFTSSILFLAGVLAKEFMIIAPGLFVLVAWLRDKLSLSQIVKLLAVYIPGVIIYLVMRYAALGPAFWGPQDIAFIKNPLFYADKMVRLGTGLKAVTVYVFKTLVPLKLSASYAFDHFKLVTNTGKSGEAVVAVLLIAAVGWGVWMRKYRTSPVVVGMVIFLAAIALSSNLVILVTDLFAERWAYFPSIGISISTAGVWAFVYRKHKRLAIVGLAILLSVYGIQLINRNRMWVTNESFNKQVAIDAPDSVHARLMAAQYFAGKGDFVSAKPHIQAGLKINRYPVLVELAAISAFNEGDFDQADKLSREALAGLDPNIPHRAHLVQAVALAHKGEYKRSLDLVKWVLTHARDEGNVGVKGGLPEFTFREDNPAIRYILAINYYKLGDKRTAEKYFDWDTNISMREKIDMIEAF